MKPLTIPQTMKTELTEILITDLLALGFKHGTAYGKHFLRRFSASKRIVISHKEEDGTCVEVSNENGFTLYTMNFSPSVPPHVIVAAVKEAM